MENTPTTLTPAMRQYVDAHRDLPEGTILLFRMGDFYELFFEDAKIAAPVLGIVLTSRAGVTMCGVPYHSIQTHIRKLIDNGFRVAVAEQVEDPKLVKGLVKREITQIITPGTIVDSDNLVGNKSNFLVGIFPQKKEYGLAVIDITTGDFRITTLSNTKDLENELNRLQPAEILISNSQKKQWDEFPEEKPDIDPKITLSPLDNWIFDYKYATELLCRHFKVSSLDGFGCRDQNSAVSAAGAIYYYVENNLRCNLDHITALLPYRTQDGMILDRISQRNLELIEPIFTGGKNATLLSILDRTETPMGGRKIRDWILRPLGNLDAINQRLDAVESMIQNPLLLTELREALGAVRDLERTLVRLTIGSANGRDLKAMEISLDVIPGLRDILQYTHSPLLSQLAEQLQPQHELTQLIAAAIIDEPPLTIKEGGIIRDGYHEVLDDYRKAMSQNKTWMTELQQREIERTGIKNLKIAYNKVFGYFIEVTKSYQHLVPQDYIRKQTLVNCERYITPELKEIEDKVLGAEEKSKTLEYELFQQIREHVTTHTRVIQQIASAIGSLDALASLADVAIRNNYVRPQIVQAPILDIRDGRHPVLDALMTEEQFVPNDTYLDVEEHQLALITGPNMAGKSTYIRQVALLTIMGHIGSFIPASSATIGLTDRIFTRIGAADDIARGQSTFMVEMIETANILNNATPRSLIILDEIGRGTSTFDGLSLAWAIAEFLHDDPQAKARTLFATHYHELTELTLTKSGVKTFTVAVQEHGEEITFLRKIVPGTADKSYGIHVARLAGIPQTVIERADEVLENLENNEFASSGEPKIAAAPKTIRRPRIKINENQPSLFDL